MESAPNEEVILKKRIRWIVALAVVASLTVVSIAMFAGGSSADDPGQQRAVDAALEAVPGELLEVEAEDNGADGYEVEIRTADGTEVEVHVDLDGNVLSTGGDDHDTGGEDDND